MAMDAEVFGGRKRTKLEPAILSVIGWHAKESVEEIVERKCNDIKKIGQTFWFFQSWKAPIPYVQAQFSESHRNFPKGRGVSHKRQFGSKRDVAR